MKRLIEVFKTLMYLGTQIKFLIEAYETLDANSDYLQPIKFKGFYSNLAFDKAISSNLQNYMLIISCSFLDEFNQELTPAKHPLYWDRIIRLKKIVKPITARINKWTDLKDFRNVLLAHNLRIKDTSVFSEDISIRFFNIPITNNEQVLLSELLIMLTTNIYNEFPDVFQQIDMTETLLSKLKFNYPVINVTAEKEQILRQVNEIKETL